MAAKTLLATGDVTVLDYRCEYGPGDVAFVECHAAYAVSYVRAGGFGYRSRGVSHELVAGSLMVSFPGDEYVCSHEHACGGDAWSSAT